MKELLVCQGIKPELKTPFATNVTREGLAADYVAQVSSDLQSSYLPFALAGPMEEPSSGYRRIQQPWTWRLSECYRQPCL